MTVSECVEKYLLARDVSANYARLLLARVQRFLTWRGGDFLIADLDCDDVNRFLAHLQQTEASRVTVDNYRRAILCVWRDSYLARENDHPPLRVRPIRQPRRIVTAFTRDEIRRIVAVAADLAGFFPNGVRRKDFWLAAIGSAYSTGLRRGDLLAIRKDQIRTDGVVRLVQSKTGYPITVQIADEALAAIRRMPLDEPLAFPWPYHANAMPRQFRRLVKDAGVRPGQFRWLRASAGSYAEQEQPGAGARMLGHRGEQVFRAHYEDQSITRAAPLTPPPL